jgi:hypothetical protein
MMGYGNAHERAWLWMLSPTLLLVAAAGFAVWASNGEDYRCTRQRRRANRGHDS